ncbi:DUF2786 domain-containing protein [Modestobacter sp. NPDC049651]|uniref:DUF2786 domain-containing protein n=1 Tax=unclassified Modestobacter TaxID=2643866 RepID=UPI0033D85536
MDDDVLRLVLAGARLAAQPGVTTQELDRVVDRLLVRDPGVDSAGVAHTVLLELLPPLWEAGWQPADVVHVVGRRVTQRAARLAAGLVATGGRAAAAGMPTSWAAQLAELGGAPGSVRDWWQAEGIAPAAGWRDVLRVTGVLRTLPRLEQLLPPPSAWSASSRPAADAAAVVTDERALGRIRGLLAKAESTEFEAEAESLTAKAQELMSRYAIDAAMLAGGGADWTAAEVEARRLHLTDPHSEAKAALVQAVAGVNGVRVVLVPAFGIVTMVGMRSDVDLVELLVTSLLVQAGRGLGEATRSGGARARSTAFRRGFLYAYAQRIEERLSEARDQARTEARAEYGSALAPVLADRQAAVDRAVEDLFPQLRRRGGRTVDAAGWTAGRQAADAADLGGTRARLGPA